jgi:hypothetical protein
MKTIIFGALMLLGSASWAQDPAPAAQQEISHLFSYLKASGCQFNRNGSWYSPEDAAGHLDDKYQYLLKHDMVNSAEDFIEYAATKSSFSGRAYLVKCGAAEPVETGAWFRAELQKYRRAGIAASAKH